MRKHAFLKDNVVVKCESISQEQYNLEIKNYDMIVDVEDILPSPSVGWVLNGNNLVSNISLDQDDMDFFQQKTQREYGLKLLPLSMDLIGARNLKLSREGTPADIASLASQMASIKLLMEGGALKTARDILIMIKPLYPNHEDILIYVINEINNFLTINGWQ